MPNISITRRCKRGCDYCFAMHERGRVEMLDMPRDVYERTLAFLQRSKIHDARLLGGEPAEHPAFREYVALALDRGFAVTVFTGGLMPDASLECLCQIPAGRITVILNAMVPGTDRAEWVVAQERVCQALGAKVELGITMHSPSSSPDHLLDWIARHGLRRRVRLGVAQPIWGGSNASLRPQSTRVLGGTLETFIGRAEKVGVEIDFDCGFTPCMFSHRFMEEHANLSLSIGSRCDSIIDILPEGAAIACYALSRVRRLPLTDSSTRDELIAMFDQELESLLPVGIYRDCVSCEHHSAGRCGGGCRARRALRLRPDASRLLKESR